MRTEMRSVFIATGGFLGRIDSEMRCGFWAEEPVDHGFDPRKLIEVDLAATPSAAAAGRIGWDAVIVDDCYPAANGGHGGTHPGSAVAGDPARRGHLSGPVVRGRPARELAASVSTDGTGRAAVRVHDCVVLATCRRSRGGKRYAGHHAEVLDERGELALVAVYAPGRSETLDARQPPMWIDLSSPDQCDAGPDSLTTVGVKNAPKSGALFLVCGTIATASGRKW